MDTVQSRILAPELEGRLFLQNTPKFEVMDWTALSQEEKNQISQNSTFDIDFVSVTGPAERLLSDESFIELIGNSSGKICQIASIQNVRAKHFGRMLLYAKLGDWLLGEPLTRETLEEAAEMDFDEQNLDSNCSNTQANTC